MAHKYKIYGLVVESPVSLGGAVPAEAGEETDVAVRFENIETSADGNESLYKTRNERRSWRMAYDARRMSFNCPAGFFKITDGSEIIIDPYGDADGEQLKMFLMGSAMGAALVQRGRIPLHGGAVAGKDGAVIISGAQGAGKSTMTSAFVENGFKYLSDDVSPVEITGGEASVIPAYPQRKLAGDMLATFGRAPEDLIIIDKKRNKYAVRDPANWRAEPLELSTLIELSPAPVESKVEAERIIGADKLKFVTRNLYRAWMHTPEGDMPPEMFKKILIVAAQAEIYRVRVPRRTDIIKETAGEIASVLKI